MKKKNLIVICVLSIILIMTFGTIPAFASSDEFVAETVSLSETSYTYDGEVHKPSVNVYNADGELISNEHYKVKYSSGRKAIGKYSVTVTSYDSKGKTTAKIKKTFKIIPPQTRITGVNMDDGTLTVKWKKITKNTNGYQIAYSTDKSFDNDKRITIKKNNATAKKIKGLNEDKKYYVKIRTYKIVDGNKYYSRWSPVQKIGRSSSDIHKSFVKLKKYLVEREDEELVFQYTQNEIGRIKYNNIDGDDVFQFEYLIYTNDPYRKDDSSTSVTMFLSEQKSGICADVYIEEGYEDGIAGSTGENDIEAYVFIMPMEDLGYTSDLRYDCTFFNEIEEQAFKMSNIDIDYYMGLNLQQALDFWNIIFSFSSPADVDLYDLGFENWNHITK